MENCIEINGEKYKKMSDSEMDYCIVRARAGVFFGRINARETKNQSNKVVDAIRLWYWDGAASLSQLANEGVKRPQNCKFAQAVSELYLYEIIEIKVDFNIAFGFKWPISCPK